LSPRQEGGGRKIGGHSSVSLRNQRETGGEKLNISLPIHDKGKQYHPEMSLPYLTKEGIRRLKKGRSYAKGVIVLHRTSRKKTRGAVQGNRKPTLLFLRIFRPKKKSIEDIEWISHRRGGGGKQEKGCKIRHHEGKSWSTGPGTEGKIGVTGAMSKKILWGSFREIPKELLAGACGIEAIWMGRKQRGEEGTGKRRGGGGTRRREREF